MRRVVRQTGKVKNARRYVPHCTLCKWAGQGYGGPVFAGWAALGHATSSHPDADGIVGYIQKVNNEEVVDIDPDEQIIS